MSDPKLPSPEELRRQLAEFIKTQFGSEVRFAAFPQTSEVPPDPEPEAAERDVFVFDKLPRDIKAHLDRFVIQQDDAKKVLAIAVCDHYNHIRQLRALAAQNPEHARQLEYVKQNVILIGPTGVGKTYLVKHIADLIGVPFVKADATKFSETGYVGGDVEDLVRDLVHKADGDVELAHYGIIYIDEIDKIASASNLAGRDVSGRGVQTTLLKLMEDTDVPVRSPSDLQAQLQAAMEMQRSGKRRATEVINTRHILFIVSGAFDRLTELIARRVTTSRIGFGAPAGSEHPADLLRQVTTRDFIEFGFEPEFIGRLPVRVVCDELRAEDLYEILKRSEGSIIRQYERAFRAYNIEVFFEDAAMREIARLAAGEKTGARGLLTVCERVLRGFKYELPGSGVTRFTIDPALIADPGAVLRTLLAQGQHEKAEALGAVAREFAQRFTERHGVEVEFSDAAIDALVERATAEDVHMRD
ncbi:MAG: AAA family ATPase, partial [Verrucomicrobiota bacterium]|nr:AAA family ATPase [Verrucomicrobiota bacterium]